MTTSPQRVTKRLSRLTALPDGDTLRAYARLAKLDIYDYYLGILVVWSLLPATLGRSGRTLATLTTFLLSEVLVVAACVAFDDLNGYRDGSDRANYGPDAPARKLARKPLLTGALRPGQALRFGWVALIAAVIVSIAAIDVAPQQPLWAIIVTAACLIVFVQYSWGLKFSYIGCSEIVLAGLGVGWVIAPYGLLAGTAPALVLIQAITFGMGPMLFGVWSNTNDVAGDRAVHRRTAATLLTPRQNQAFITIVTLGQVALIVGAPLLGWAPWWYPLALLGTIALRVHQLRVGIGQGDILRARNIGIRTHRVTVLALLAANVAAAVVVGNPSGSVS